MRSSQPAPSCPITSPRFRTPLCEYKYIFSFHAVATQLHLLSRAGNPSWRSFHASTPRQPLNLRLWNCVVSQMTVKARDATDGCGRQGAWWRHLPKWTPHHRHTYILLLSEHCHGKGRITQHHFQVQTHVHSDICCSAGYTSQAEVPLIPSVRNESNKHG